MNAWYVDKRNHFRLNEHLKAIFKKYFITKRVLRAVALFFGAMVALFILIFFLVITGILGHLPTRDELRLVENPVASEVYSADSVLLGRYFLQERSDIDYQDIPQSVANAVIATEDVRFYEHHGVDYKSLFRVFFKSILLQHESSGGGSTLTQQLAKNLYPRKKYYAFSMVINKMREMVIASRLERVYDKPQILTLYLNTIPFGDNTFGIEAAAQRFFNIHARNLTAVQASVLIGMLKATHAYNPRLFPERALTRRNVVLGQMEKYNFLSKPQADSLKALPLALSYNRITHHEGLAPYFREYLRAELTAWCRSHKKADGTAYNLYLDGLKVYTTIDSRLQRYAENAVAEQMTILQKKFLAQYNASDPQVKAALKEAIARSDRYRQLKEQGLSIGTIDKLMRTPVRMSVFTWNGEQDVTLSAMDSIRHYLTFLQAGVLGMNPRRGNILVWVGGINHTYFQYDHVHENTRRQVGSTFKPIVYAAALERGEKPCEFISAEKTVYTNMDEWAPENTEENYDLKFSMEGALAYSVNTVSVKVLERAGISNTIALAQKMGIRSPLPAVPSLALGTANISMMEMVNAYSCFANSGKTVKPFYLTAITTRTNQMLENFQLEKTSVQALSPENAKLMVHMLKRTVNEGTGSSLRSQYNVRNDIAGKTGTTQSNTDGWFIAMTPQLVIGAWVGSDDPRIHFRTTAQGQGARTALPIVGKFFQSVNRDTEFNSLAHASFPPLSAAEEDELDCALYKSDMNLLQKIFGKREREHERAFGEQKKKGFLNKLFGKRKS